MTIYVYTREKGLLLVVAHQKRKKRAPENNTLDKMPGGGPIIYYLRPVSQIIQKIVLTLCKSHPPIHNVNMSNESTFL
jgi:hypothetical protein